MKFSDALDEYIDLKNMEHSKIGRGGTMPAYVSKGLNTAEYYKRLGRLREILDKIVYTENPTQARINLVSNN